MSAQEDDRDHPYWAKVEKVIMVPVKVQYHDATGIVFGFTKPTLEDCEKALRTSKE